MQQTTQALTQEEWTDQDFEIGHRVGRAMGYAQMVYTSTSALWGLFCLAENPATAKPGEPLHKACIIKTRELGFLVVQDLEELGLLRNGAPRAGAPRLRGVR